MVKQAMPINEAEAILEPFWDPNISPFSDYEVFAEPTAAARVYQNWCWVALDWTSAKEGQILARLARTLDVDLQDYDKIILRVNLTKGAALSLRVWADGQEQTAIQDVEGNDQAQDFSGPIRGKRLERLEIIVRAASTGLGSGWILWIGFANTPRLAWIQRRRLSSPYDPSWPKSLLPKDARMEFKPAIGLFFDSEDLAPLRQKANSPVYRPLMDKLRQQAREAIVQLHPEDMIGNYAPWNDPRWIRDNQSDLGTPAVKCALVGLLDEDAELLRFGARCALSLSCCTWWDESFLIHFPGSTFMHGAFVAAASSAVVACVLDWAGGILTETGRCQLENALCRKGLPKIQQMFMQAEYIRHCNQGCAFGHGWILGLLALAKRYPHVEEFIPAAEAGLIASLANSIAEDGGSCEGPGYWSAWSYLEALIPLARHRGVEPNRYLRDQLPGKFSRLGDYVRTMLSTTRPAGGYIPIADSGHGGGCMFAPGSLALLTGPLGQSDLTPLLAEILPAAFPSGGQYNPTYSVMPLIHGPQDIHIAPRVTPAIFSRMPVIGQLASCRPSNLGLIRFHFVGAMANAGHSHEDKGSFVLEVGGRALLIDRGITSYADPRTELFPRAEWHNLLTPAGVKQGQIHQLNPAPDAFIPEGNGDEKSLHARLDLTAAWGGIFKRLIRAVESPTPFEFAIGDDVECETPQAVCFHLHSPFPFELAGDGASIELESVRLKINAEWEIAERWTGADGINSALEPVYHLKLTSQPHCRHRLVTKMRLEAVAI